MVRQWQELFYDKRYVCTDMNCAPDFVKLAEAYGALGLRASKPQEVEQVLKEGLAVSRPVIMDFKVDREESVYPIVITSYSIHYTKLYDEALKAATSSAGDSLPI